MGLSCSIAYLHKYRTCLQVEINLDVHWKAFYILTHFIPWMNTSVTISIQTSTKVIS
jgi:hypothetical protein